MRGKGRSTVAPTAPSFEQEEEPELVDLTEKLTVRSKRTERRKKKQQQKTRRADSDPVTLGDLPYELIANILARLRPSDLIRLSRVSKGYREFVEVHQEHLAGDITRWRYPALAKCLRLPALLADVDPAAHWALQSDEREEMLAIHKKPYQHVRPPDTSLICTCLSCMLRWNALCLAVDFAHWQPSLEKGEPIPIIPRGTSPAWNQRLLAENAAVVTKALRSPLWYACILEAHLDSTTRSIRRHAQNKGNKRRRFRMTKEDEEAGTDAFLERSGPPTLEFPFHRDNYYMLEAFLPNRGWNAEKERWMYVPAEQHEQDLEFVIRWAKRKRAAKAESAERGGA